MLIVLCYKYLIMQVYVVQSEFVVRQIPFRGDRSPHTALPDLVEPPSACLHRRGCGPRVVTGREIHNGGLSRSPHRRSRSQWRHVKRGIDLRKEKVQVLKG